MKRVISLTILLITWGIMLVAFAIIAELLLVPWDTAITLPEIGTWQRTLNDFFAQTAVQYIISGMLIALSLALTVRVLRQRPLFAVKLAAGNIVFVCLAFGVLVISAVISTQVLFPYPPVRYDPTYIGYHLTALPGLTVLVVIAGWLLWQRWIMSQFTDP